MSTLLEPDATDGVDHGLDLDPDGYGRSGEPGDRAEPGKPYVKPARLLIMVALFGALAAFRGLPVLVVIFGILVMIFFHELGHFVMARRSGMKVTEFMIGFGPRIFSFRRGDVEYGVKAIPAGAYVKIIGMANVEEVPPQDEAQTYRQKGYWARMGVAVAGSTMHFIMALVLITLSFVIVGREDPTKWAVDTIAPDSAAANAGIRSGDKVVSMDGVSAATWDRMAKEAQKRPGKTIPVGVERNGKVVELTATITPRFFVFGTTGEEFQLYGNGDGGFSVSVPTKSKLVAQGLRDGDVVTAVDGTGFTSLAELRKLLGADRIAKSGEMDLTVRHDGDSTTTTAHVDLGTGVGLGTTQGFFGVGQELVPEKLGVIEAVPEAFGWFGTLTKQTVLGIGHFFSPSSLGDFAKRTFSTTPGEAHESSTPQSNATTATQNVEKNSNRIVSIVGAVVLGDELTASGWGRLLAFFAALNVAIGLFNLIPLPPFDGGHVAIGTYEKIRELLRRDGKRYFADYNKVMPVAMAVVSFMLIVGLMAIYLDLADPIRL
ncbi:MAG: site-2 protease family protein [Acidimicrobiales bacterium]